MEKPRTEEPLLNAPLNRINSEENNFNSEKNRKTSELNPIEIKENKNIDNIAFSPELERAFQIYLAVRKSNYGDVPDEQIRALRDDLLSLSDKEEERIAIVKKATASGWKSFYRTEKKRESFSRAKGKVKDNNNFERRKYDFEALESELIG